MSANKIKAWDLEIALQDCMSMFQNQEEFKNLLVVRDRVLADYFKTRRELVKLEAEQEALTEILAWRQNDENFEMREVYEARLVKVSELASKFEQEENRLKQEAIDNFVELNDEEFQTFTLVNSWSYLSNRNRTQFYQSNK